ncbi:MAG: HNH endonuclease [Chloroflexi bacterium]|nr:HNH endonuclease [Chloroflexota bacterium]
MTVRPVPKPTPLTVKQRQKLHSRPRPVDRRAATETFERAHYTCEWCGEQGGHLDPHHVQRRSQGGSDSATNLKALHRRCHRYVHEHPAEAKRRGFLA